MPSTIALARSAASSSPITSILLNTSQRGFCARFSLYWFNSLMMTLAFSTGSDSSIGAMSTGAAARGNVPCFRKRMPGLRLRMRPRSAPECRRPQSSARGPCAPRRARHQRGKRIVGHLRLGGGHRADEGRFAGVRQAQHAHIGQQQQFQQQVARFTGGTQRLLTRCTVDRRFETGVAGPCQPPLATISFARGGSCRRGSRRCPDPSRACRPAP